MGGSLGMACLEKPLVSEIYGFDLDPRRCESALTRGAITKIGSSLAAAVASADLVFLATPVSTIAAVFNECIPHLKTGAIVTDMGSTKAGVVKEIAGACPPGIHFIGGHPIAGSEKEGIDAADADLYAGCYWILTPTKQTDATAYQTLVRFLTRLGARVVSLDPRRHDEAMALTSHLPQLLSTTLMEFADQIAASEEGLPLLSAGGFQDMTRIAGSSPVLWVDIVKENQPAVSDMLRRFGSALDAVARQLEGQDWQTLHDHFERGRQARRRLSAKPGLGPEELVEIMVAVSDRTGVLAEVTTTVGEAGINIEDVDILHSVEGGRGVVHLSVKGHEQAVVARDAVRAKGYQAEIE